MITIVTTPGCCRYIITNNIHLMPAQPRLSLVTSRYIYHANFPNFHPTYLVTVIKVSGRNCSTNKLVGSLRAIIPSHRLYSLGSTPTHKFQFYSPVSYVFLRASVYSFFSTPPSKPPFRWRFSGAKARQWCVTIERFEIYNTVLLLPLTSIVKRWFWFMASTRHFCRRSYR